MRNWCRRSRADSGNLAPAGSDNPSASSQAMTSSEGLWSAAGTSPMQQSWSRCRLGERQGRQSEGTRRRWRLGEVARGPPRRNREVCCVRGGSAIFDEGVPVKHGVRPLRQCSRDELQAGSGCGSGRPRGARHRPGARGAPPQRPCGRGGWRASSLRPSLVRPGHVRGSRRPGAPLASTAASSRSSPSAGSNNRRPSTPCEQTSSATSSAALVLERAGRAALIAGAVAVAVRHLEAAVRFRGNRVDAGLLLALAEALVGIGRMDDASAVCERLLADAPLPCRTGSRCCACSVGRFI